MGEEVLTALSPSQQVVKIVHDELIKILGSHESKLRFANEPPSVFLIVGCRAPARPPPPANWRAGCRRTATADGGFGGRLPSGRARAVARRRARHQACRSTKARRKKQRPLDLARSARREAVNSGRDVLLVDTAGRLHIDDELMTELQQLKEQLNPVEILFVADAMTGQDAVKSADEFHKRLGITGVILTKMDGDARGGAALSIRHVTGQPLKFVGVGEKSDAFEPFHPDRAAYRILGMGDILSFIEKAEEAIDKKQAVEMQRKLIDNEFTLEDFRDQLQAAPQAGSARIDARNDAARWACMKELKNVKVDEKEINRVVAIIDSMTPKERDNHMIINGSRRRRIAKGSGTSVQEVNQLLKQYAQARKMMKTFSGWLLGKKLGKMKLPGGFPFGNLPA